MHKDGKWAKRIIALQEDDGKWGLLSFFVTIL